MNESTSTNHVSVDQEELMAREPTHATTTASTDRLDPEGRVDTTELEEYVAEIDSLAMHESQDSIAL